MGSSEKFCLRWNDFETNISSAFHELKEEKDFTDVTLACADNQVEAHQVILAASSPFFKRILKKNPHSHPIIYLKGIKSSDVEDVLNYIYHGEVNVEEANLNAFLEVGEELEVKGLVHDKKFGDGGSNMFSSNPSTNMQSPKSRITMQSPAPRSSLQSASQTYFQSSSQTEQEYSTSVNNNMAVHVKVESEETFPASEEEQQQNHFDSLSLNHLQEQCSQALSTVINWVPFRVPGPLGDPMVYFGPPFCTRSPFSLF